MKVYEVGGAVRDTLLDKKAKDRDWVVVGSSPEEMVSKGFKPIGKDFPVFLHPTSNEEYALARTEKKTGHGYHGFNFYFGKEVTLEEDLSRRDLTINAIAKDEDGNLIESELESNENEKIVLPDRVALVLKADSIGTLAALKKLVDEVSIIYNVLLQSVR